MRVRLMHTDRRFDVEELLTPATDDLTTDLGVEAMLDQMASGDPFLRAVARAALFQPLTDPDAIGYRQAVLTDVVEHSDVVGRMYATAVAAAEVPRHTLLGWHSDRPSTRLAHARSCMAEYVELLRTLRGEVDAHSAEFTSTGMRGMCASLHEELSDTYLDEIQQYLDVLGLRTGVLETARLGRANEGREYVLRHPERTRPGLVEMLGLARHRHTVRVADRDIAGMDELSDLREQGLVVAAVAADRSARLVAGFFAELRTELAFYLGCLNLRALLTNARLDVCLPNARPLGETGLVARGLYDPLLVIHAEQPVGSDVDADGDGLIVVTGANQGGKSTFLRALGLAQLMMQAGMFVAAVEFSGAVAGAIYPHFKREEDDTMRHGKFDEELDRMSKIVDRAAPGDLVLCNESFSATNEREATIVGAGVIEGLLAGGVRLHLVTHYYAFATALAHDVDAAAFLRAERLDDGTRSHRIVPGEPLRTSHAADLYAQVFGEPLVAA